MDYTLGFSGIIRVADWQSSARKWRNIEYDESLRYIYSITRPLFNISLRQTYLEIHRNTNKDKQYAEWLNLFLLFQLRRLRQSGEWLLFLRFPIFFVLTVRIEGSIFPPFLWGRTVQRTGKGRTNVVLFLCALLFVCCLHWGRLRAVLWPIRVTVCWSCYSNSKYSVNLLLLQLQFEPHSTN